MVEQLTGEQLLKRQIALRKLETQLDDDYLATNEPLSQWSGRLIGLLVFCLAGECLFWLSILVPNGFIWYLNTFLKIGETVGIVGLAALAILQSIESYKFEQRKAEAIKAFEAEWSQAEATS